MREIKAYIRREKVQHVVHGLREAGVAQLSLNHVHSVGGGVDRKHWELSVEAGERAMQMTKLELVCADPEAQGLVEVIRRYACTGSPGDGLIFVSSVDEAVKIRTGVRGREAVR